MIQIRLRINVTFSEYKVSKQATITFSTKLIRIYCLNRTITTIVATAMIVIHVCSGNRFFSEWKEKMDCGRCVIGMQTIIITILYFTIYCLCCFRFTTFPTGNKRLDGYKVVVERFPTYLHISIFVLHFHKVTKH